MLELRPTCENCNKALPPNSPEARICSYECTFCASCVEEVLANVCPNCGGGFVPRPIRPARNWRRTMTARGRMQTEGREIRQARPQDFESLARIYSDSIRHVGREFYSPAQVDAWSSYAGDTEEFRAWLDRSTTFVAVDRSDECLGFAGLEPRGRIASLFVAPACMRQGIAGNLVRHLLAEARSRGLEVVTTEASEFSKPVFEKCGFTVTEMEFTRFKGVDFSRYAMRVRLLGPANLQRS
jgi:putative acetyltransferase